MLLTVAVGLVASACSQSPAPSVQADKDVAKSFSAMTKDEVLKRLEAGVGVTQLGDVSYLEIQKSALDKEFLLSGSVINQRGAPTSSGLQGRIVAFAKHGKTIFLMEATDGHVVTDSLPSSLILAEMPVILETETSYVIDFNAGMKKIFTSSNWYASDTVEAAAYEADKPLPAASVNVSFLKKIQVVDGENIEIRQVVQATEGEGIGTYEARYFLRPYVKNEGFVSKENQDFVRVGLFETPPVLEKNSGRSVVNTTRFDISKPVKFYVSANTPAAYRAAVLEGILHWNKIFGREVLQAEIAPEGVTAPDARHNIVQWVEWDQAGFAYADALSDPRTGEIKHAQVYLTSAFAWGGRIHARRLLRRNDESSADARQAAFAQKLGLKGLSSSNLCMNDATDRITQVAELAMRSGASDQTLLRLSQDYVRSVVAHEVGHTLGLRHNFAGNFGANASPAIVDERLNALVKDAKTPVEDLVVSNSVMEYLDVPEDLIAGEQIGRGMDAFAYDRVAIRHAYFGEKLNADSPLFCSDGQASEASPNFLIDCVRHDRGRNLIEGNLHVARKVIGDLPLSFVESHLAALAPPIGRRPKDIETLSVDPNTRAKEIGAALTQAFKPLNPDANSIHILRKYPFENSLNKDQILKDRYEFVREEAQRQGGFQKMIFDVLASEERGLLREDWVKTQVDAVRKVLSRPSVTEFQGYEGQTVRLSEEQKAAILQKAQPYFAALQQVLVKKIVAVLSETSWNLELQALGDLREDGLTIALENGIAEVMPKIVLSRADRKVVIPLAPDNKVLFQAFLFNADVREGAAGLMGSSLVELKNWSKVAREKTKSDYESIMKAALSLESLDKIDELISAGNRSLQLWWKTEARVLGNLE
jgi:hypothetical protein